MRISAFCLSMLLCVAFTSSASAAAITWSATESYDNGVQLLGTTVLANDNSEPIAFVKQTDGGENVLAEGRVSYDTATRTLTSQAESRYFGTQAFSSRTTVADTQGLWTFTVDAATDVEITPLLSGYQTPSSASYLYQNASVYAESWVYDGVSFIYKYVYTEDKFGSELVETGSRFFESEVGRTYSLFLKLRTTAGWEAGSSPIPGDYYSTADYEFSAGVVVVPEPCTLALVAIGGMTLLRRKHRR